uniref:Neprilysin n=1 Tax=Angiostrongylus cantonensis TaxID=6313 RepID=A0A158P9J3_ANGCA
MDPTIDPCVDFYNYACGKWINNSVNLNYPSWNVLYEANMKAHDKIVNVILKVINGDSSIPLNRGERAAVELFNQCTDMNKLRTIGLNTWLRFVEELGGWMRELKQDVPSVPLHLSILNAYNYTVFPLFGVDVDVNYFDSKTHIITIYEQLPLLLNPSLFQSKVPVTAEMILNKQGPQVTSLLQETGEEMATLLGFDRNSQAVREMISKMIELEWRITTTGARQYSHGNEDYEVVSIAELQMIAPVLNWKFFLSSLIGVEIRADEKIALKGGREWLVKLARILLEYMKSEERLSVVRNYIKWKTLFFHLAYVKPKCRNGYLWSVVEIYSGPPHLRKEFCIMRASGIFPLSLPSVLRKIDGTERSRTFVKNISRHIMDTYPPIALQKLSNLSILVSYPDKMDDEKAMEIEGDRISTELFWSMVFGAGAVYREKIERLRKPVDPRAWVDSRPALSSTPIHNYERNLVQLPYDIVRSPFADYDLLDFASMGTIIGHEITHAFDEQGKFHGPTGNLGQKWWSLESKKKFYEREACYIEQYARLTGSNDEAEARVSLYENIADNVGLEVAFKAWNAHGRRTFRKLAGLSLNEQQLFFLGYAQSWCALKGNRQRGVHMLEEKRQVGLAIQNSAEFASAFSCALNSPMNPQRKCVLW